MSCGNPLTFQCLTLDWKGTETKKSQGTKYDKAYRINQILVFLVQSNIEITSATNNLQ